MGLLWDKWMLNTTFMLRGARTVTAIWCIWCLMIFTFHVAHPEPYCEIRGSAAAAADNCATWLKACNSVRSQHRDGAGVQFFSRAVRRSPCGQSPRAVGHCIALVASGAAVRTQKKEWHRLWEIYESDKYVLFDVAQNSFSATPRPRVPVIDGRTVRSPCPLLELFMLCFPS